MCCLPRDLPIARLAVDGVRRYVSSGKICIATHPNAFAECRRMLGDEVELIDECKISGGMTINQLRELRVEGFPARAGWYLQQMAKLGYATVGAPDEHYLIWDCDTVPLRKIDLFDIKGIIPQTGAGAEASQKTKNFSQPIATSFWPILLDFSALAVQRPFDHFIVARFISRSSSRFLRSSRLSKLCLPLPTPRETFTLPFFQ